MIHHFKISKSFFSILCVIMIVGCKSKKVDAPTEMKEKTVSITSLCPTDGKCSLEIFKNKSLNVLSDQFGSVYTQQIDATETSVIVFTYDRDVPKDLQDAHYREEIIFEIKNSDKNLNLSDKELQFTKMIFGRFCFCRGQTGYYKVSSGSLSLKQNKNAYTLDLNFKVNDVPHKIEKITATIN